MLGFRPPEVLGKWAMGLRLSTALGQGHWGWKEGMYKAQPTWPRVVSLAWFRTGSGTRRKIKAWPKATH